jgi:hypothetical protein
MPRNVFYLEECCACTWKERVFCCGWVLMLYKSELGQSVSGICLLCSYWSFVLSITKKRVAMSPTIILSISTTPFTFVNLWLIYFEALLLGIHTPELFLTNWPFQHWAMSLIILGKISFPEVYFVLY